MPSSPVSPSASSRAVQLDHFCPRIPKSADRLTVAALLTSCPTPPSLRLPGVPDETNPPLPSQNLATFNQHRERERAINGDHTGGKRSSLSVGALSPSKTKQLSLSSPQNRLDNVSMPSRSPQCSPHLSRHRSEPFTTTYSSRSPPCMSERSRYTLRPSASSSLGNSYFGRGTVNDATLAFIPSSILTADHSTARSFDGTSVASSQSLPLALASFVNEERYPVIPPELALDMNAKPFSHHNLRARSPPSSFPVRPGARLPTRARMPSFTLQEGETIANTAVARFESVSPTMGFSTPIRQEESRPPSSIYSSTPGTPISPVLPVFPLHRSNIHQATCQYRPGSPPPYDLLRELNDTKDEYAETKPTHLPALDSFELATKLSDHSKRQANDDAQSFTSCSCSTTDATSEVDGINSGENPQDRPRQHQVMPINPCSAVLDPVSSRQSLYEETSISWTDECDDTSKGMSSVGFSQADTATVVGLGLMGMM